MTEKTEAEKLDAWRMQEASRTAYHRVRGTTRFAEYRRLVREDVRPPEPKTLEQRLLEEARKMVVGDGFDAADDREDVTSGKWDRFSDVQFRLEGLRRGVEIGKELKDD